MLRTTICLICLVMAPFMGSGQSFDCSSGRFMESLFPDVNITTVTYGRNTNAAQLSVPLLVDIYEPVGDEAANRPLIVLAFGGSFIAGSRGDLAPFCSLLASKGYVCASIDYRIWPLFILGIPTEADITKIAFGAISDMKAAVRFFRQSVAEGNPYQIDTNFITIGGISAGSITALHSGMIDDRDILSTQIQEGFDLIGGLEGNSGDSTNMSYSSKVHAILNFSGALLDTSFIDANDPIIYSFHGDADGTVPYGTGLASGQVPVFGSQLIHEKANQVGLQNRLVTVEGGDHTDIYLEEQFRPQLFAFYADIDQFTRDRLCDQITSVQESEIPDAYTVFPNPTNEDLWIQSANSADIRAISIQDLSGRSFLLNYQQTNGMVHINRLPFKGAAIVSIKTDEFVSHHKVIIQ